jgi:hypothetical protein
MSLQRLTLYHISCFDISFPLLGTTEYPQASFAIANVFSYWIQQNILILPLAPCGHLGIAIPIPLIQQDKLTRAFLISQQVVPY